MDLFTALQTSVSGLQAQSYAISNISGNIANSQTTGFKRIDTSFVDMMSETTPKREVAGSVLAQSQLTNTIAGNVVASSVPTNMAINGNGFFTVVRKTGDSNGAATFSGTDVYTRRGDFAQDKDGYLVNGAGGYLTGTNLDPVTGQATSTGLLKIGNTSLPAQPTTSIAYAANLPATPATTASVTSGSDVYDQLPTAVVKTGTGVTGVSVPSTGAGTFVNNSIAGPSITAYTQTGAPVTLSTRWAKVQDASTTPAQPAVWNLYYASDPSASANSTAWQNVGTAFTFDSTGKLTAPATSPVALGNVTVGDYTFANMTMNVGTAGLTQYADTSGAVTTNTLSQNGNSAGTLTSVAIGDDGKINGTFSNGSVLALASVGIAQFANPDGLKADSNGNYLQTAESGPALVGLNGSTITGASNEQSNTDIASEFSKMIVTQQAYSANTRVMSTAQTMMSDLLNVIR
ncbi:flagellar biosynthesis protein FlgE [Methylobacterium sp. GXS13]|jgi:flagellar hook protein FlgE|uniref:flagellar hook protein FlgE n=1 Tax=Methylobacterium sp. GXS13 TaxID=1730094 RepID=UPI00071B0224|nr:flagellar hook-basal body complex protein [Methylobacterium sp. GXS13]KST58462.1 flagellar biosynthesis protein FlgE [Methylobacterium sp. GXS13]